MQHGEIVDAIHARVKPHHRLIVAIAGPPASGKSTLAKELAVKLGRSAVVVPMDGFHLDNAVLETRGLLARKGSPETFDAPGFANLILRLKDEQQVVAPIFDRHRDAAIAGAQVIEPAHQIILVEGNYLLLDQAPWGALAPLWDMTIRVDVPMQVLEDRLVQRWITHGLAPQKARDRALGNDIPNAKTVLTGSRAADVVIKNG